MISTHDLAGTSVTGESRQTNDARNLAGTETVIDPDEKDGGFAARTIASARTADGDLDPMSSDAGRVRLISAERATDDASPEDGASERQAPPASQDTRVPDLLPPIPPEPAAGRATRTEAADRAAGLSLEEVVSSVRRTYPLLASAYQSRLIAEGEQRESWGEFDFKVKSALIRQPQGYYTNYRRSVGFEQPTYFGGQLFGSYKLVRGDVEPWYQERVTNRDGEFSGGFMMPLLQGRRIDSRRADLWKATYGRTLTEYEIQEQGIDFTLSASLAYWDWVAAGEILSLSKELLRLAEARVGFLQEQIKNERQPPIALADNRRLIVSRQAKQIEAQQKLQQNAVKLSLFLRTDDGEPIVPSSELLPPLPDPIPVDVAAASDSIPMALANRPELRQLIVARKQYEVDLALAKNMTEPSVNASVYWSKDVGAKANPDKKIDDKEPLTTEASIMVDVPLQRRKARGKMQAVEAKLAQNAAKRTYTEDKIASEVQNVHVALDAAWQTYERAVESVRLNEELQKAEMVKLELQRSDLLLLNLREQATFDAQMTEVLARLQYHQAQALRRAVLAIDAETFADPDCVPNRQEF